MVDRDINEIKEDFKKYDLPEKFIDLTYRSGTRNDMNEQMKKLADLEAIRVYETDSQSSLVRRYQCAREALLKTVVGRSKRKE